MQVKKQQLELDMEQQTGSKLGEEYVKALCSHSAHLTYMKSTSCKIPDWMNHKMESRLLRKRSTSKMQVITTLMAESEKEVKSHLIRVKEE